MTADAELHAACNRLLDLLAGRPNVSATELALIRDLSELRARLMARRPAPFNPHTVCVGPLQ